MRNKAATGVRGMTAAVMKTKHFQQRQTKSSFAEKNDSFFFFAHCCRGYRGSGARFGKVDKHSQLQTALQRLSTPEWQLSPN